MTLQLLPPSIEAICFAYIKRWEHTFTAKEYYLLIAIAAEACRLQREADATAWFAGEWPPFPSPLVVSPPQEPER